MWTPSASAQLQSGRSSPISNHRLVPIPVPQPQKYNKPAPPPMLQQQQLRKKSSSPAAPVVQNTLSGSFRHVHCSRVLSAGFVTRNKSRNLLSRTSSDLRSDDASSTIESCRAEPQIVTNMRKWRAAVHCIVCSMRLVMLQHRGLSHRERAEVHELFLKFVQSTKTYVASPGAVASVIMSDVSSRASTTGAGGDHHAAAAPASTSADHASPSRNILLSEDGGRANNIATTSSSHTQSPLYSRSSEWSSGSVVSGPICSDARLVCFIREVMGWTHVVEQREKDCGCSSGMTCEELTGYKIQFPVPFCVLTQIVGLLKHQERLRVEQVEAGSLVFSQLAVVVPRRMVRSHRHRNHNNSSNNNNNSNDGGGSRDADDSVAEDESNSDSDSSEISVASDDEHPARTIQQKLALRQADKEAYTEAVVASFDSPIAYRPRNTEGPTTTLPLTARAVTAAVETTDARLCIVPSPPPRHTTNTPAAAAAAKHRAATAGWPNSATSVSPASSTRQPAAPPTAVPRSEVFVKRVPAKLLLQVIEAAGFPDDVVSVFEHRAERHPWLTESQCCKILNDPCGTRAVEQRSKTGLRVAMMARMQAKRARARVKEASAAMMSVLWRNQQNPLQQARVAAELSGKSSSLAAADLVRQMKKRHQQQQQQQRPLSSGGNSSADAPTERGNMMNNSLAFSGRQLVTSANLSSASVFSQRSNKRTSSAADTDNNNNSSMPSYMRGIRMPAMLMSSPLTRSLFGFSPSSPGATTLALPPKLQQQQQQAQQQPSASTGGSFADTEHQHHQLSASASLKLPSASSSPNDGGSLGVSGEISSAIAGAGGGDTDEMAFSVNTAERRKKMQEASRQRQRDDERLKQAVAAAELDQQQQEREMWNAKMFAVFGDTTPPPRKTVAEFRFHELATPRRHQQSAVAETGEPVGFMGSETRWWLRGSTPNQHAATSRSLSRKALILRSGDACSATPDGDQSSRAGSRSNQRSSLSPQRQQQHALSWRRKERERRTARKKDAAAAAAKRGGKNSRAKALSDENDDDDLMHSDEDEIDEESGSTRKQRPPFHVSRERVIDFGPAPPLPKRLGKQLPPEVPGWAKVNPFEADRSWDNF